MELGELIKQEREKASLTQFQLAVKLHVQPVTVSNWERGENQPSVPTLMALDMVLNTEVFMASLNT